MQRFLLQLAAFSGLVLLFLGWLLYRTDGHVDDQYLKFTVPPQENLILGTSKAAQGLQPVAFREVLGKDIYNFAFNLGDSPWGPYYLEKIKQKVAPGTTEGLFVVTADPWSVATISSTPNDPKKFYEYKGSLARMTNINRNPNFEYLWHYYPKRFYDIAVHTDRSFFLHDDGWLEVEVDSRDSSAFAWRLKQKVKDYGGEKLRLYNYSSLRLEYLEETIRWLDERGDVYLVWLPTHPEVFAIGQQLCPQFDSLMLSIEPLTAGYLNLTPDNAKYEYTDGNHLYKDSGREVSRRIAEWIAQTEQESR